MMKVIAIALLFSTSASATDRCNVTRMKETARATKDELVKPLMKWTTAMSVGGGAAIYGSTVAAGATASTAAGVATGVALTSAAVGASVVAGAGVVGVGGVTAFMCRRNIADAVRRRVGM